MTSELYIGLMSGTSLDGVDAALVDLSGKLPGLISSARQPFDSALRAALLALNSSGDDEIERAAVAANELARRYAAAVEAVLHASSTGRNEVRAIGCHGQTVRHRPERGYTTQIGNAALLAELSGIRVVADFRSRDVAAGGQGAPLAPALHAALFQVDGEDRAVLNLGGVANVTRLARDGSVGGFDCGPASCLLDLWCSLHLRLPFDHAGEWAARGRIIPELLGQMRQEPYFALPPPKSTGRDLFNEAWLRAKLSPGDEPQAVQATLLELTARSIADAIERHCPHTRRVIVCGGGTKNIALMVRLQELLNPVPLEPSDRHGVDPQLVEAIAFAWLARQALHGVPGNLPSVTGAHGRRVLGAVYPP